jgi:hypothetical protein
MTSMPALRATEIMCAVPRDESLWNATTRSGAAASISSLRRYPALRPWRFQSAGTSIVIGTYVSAGEIVTGSFARD